MLEKLSKPLGALCGVLTCCSLAHAGEAGHLSREVWLNLPGGSLSGFVTSPSYFATPDLTETILGAEAPVDWGSDFAQRLRGYVTPTVTGTYTFWISSDDSSELWLSTGESKFDRVKIASLEGSTGQYAWDANPSQKSVDIELVAGTRYFIEVLHKEGAVSDHVEVAWTPPGMLRTLIPSANLESFTFDTNDTDGDELPDDWELANSFTVGTGAPASQHPLADPDFDGFNNLEESKRGMNPLQHSRIPGVLTLETWNNIPGDRVEQLTWNPRFAKAADKIEHVTSTNIVANRGDDYGSRLRGVVIAPVTGDYTFYLSGDDYSELWLSSGESQFDIEKIAWVNGSSDPGQWDRFASQQSVVIPLVAGQKYYLEALQKEYKGGDQLQIGWKIPGTTTIDFISGSALESHAFDLDDPDGDNIPSAWETAEGLNPNSATGNDGAAGDPDKDGIPNWLEYAVGNDPQVKDSIVGGMTREKWNNTSGNEVAPFVASPRSWQTADEISVFHRAVAPMEESDSYFARSRAWLTPPATGDYNFWIASDDHSELWLSSTASKFGRVKIASVAGATGKESWDANPSQQSVTIHLVQGESYYLETLHKEGGGGDHVAVAWQIPGGSRQVIPASALTSFTFDPNDIDNDSLRDDWELAHGFSPSDNGTLYPDQHPMADPDGDGITNFAESLAHTNPFERIREPGGLTLETWENVNGLTVDHLLYSSQFTGAPTHIEFVTSAATPTNRADNFGSRMRGVVIPPITGVYTFYLASDDQGELWLSTSESQFAKQKIASVPAATGIEQWEIFPSQQSVAITLQAGQKYYIEGLFKEAIGDDYMEIGWKIPGISTIITIPGEALEGHTRDIEDPDGDELPTSWEVAEGLDPMSALGDNGMGGDPDRDGIPNWLEYRNGTSPFTPNSMAGAMSREVWTNVAGGNSRDFTNSERFYEPPTISGLIPGGESYYNWGDDYAQRVRGIITAPVTGDYTFWIASDDNGELWFSSNESKFDRRRIAYCLGVSAAQNWDAHEFQKSATIHLEAGEKYFIEAIHKEGAGGDHLEIAWQIPGGTRQMIPGSAVATYAGDLNDENRDEMPDDWQIEHGFSLSSANTGDFHPLADPDGDNIPNWAEGLKGSDPFEANSVNGFLSFDRWSDMPYYSISSTVASKGYYATPSHSNLMVDGHTGVLTGDYIAGRARGYLEVPSSGEYTFWVSGNTSVELWLSTDDSKYKKQRLAQVTPETSGGMGIVWSAAGAPWDIFASQMSEPVTLQAGQKYFIEVVHQRGHGTVSSFSMGWAKNGGERALIPSEALWSYTQEAADADDDYLPDAWEVANGLDPADNGFTNLVKQGERGDFDADALSNRVEYLIGTDPTNPDSNGDGISDGESFYQIGGDPLAGAGAGEDVVQVIDIKTPVGGSMGWSNFGEGMVGDNFRGSIKLSFNVPESGKQWILATEGTILGQLSTTKQLKINVTLDTIDMGPHTVSFSKGESSTLRVLTPQLSGGTHHITLFIDNTIASETFQLLGVELRRPTGPDLDLNGSIDWLAWFYQQNAIISTAGDRHTSPASIEGTTRYAGNLSLTANGATVATDSGTGPHHWFANVPLAQNSTTLVTGSFEGGAKTHQVQLDWTPLDLNSVADYALRKGDTLQYHFPQSNGDTTSVTYQISGLGVYNQHPASAGVFQTFNQAGIYTLSATHANGPTATVTITVHEADFGNDALQLAVQVPRTYLLPGVSSDLTLEVAQPIRLLDRGAEAIGSYAKLDATGPGSYGVLARLGEGGPIVAKADLSVMGFASAVDGLYQTVGESPTVPGYWVVTTPIIVTNLPPGYTVRVVINRAGVMFADGTTVLILNPADFVNGVYMASFLMPDTLDGGYCHHIEILDENGAVVAIY